MSKLKPWKFPDCYSGKEWHGWLVFLGRYKGSDLIEVSNFEVAWKELHDKCGDGEVPGDPETASIQIVHETHSIFGWIEWIAIHPSNSMAVELAEEMLDSLSDYSLLSDEDFSSREVEQKNELFKEYWQYLEGKSRVKLLRKYRCTGSFKTLLGAARGDENLAQQIFCEEDVDTILTLWQTDKDLSGEA